jgi:hypothetical protein
MNPKSGVCRLRGREHRPNIFDALSQARGAPHTLHPSPSRMDPAARPGLCFNSPASPAPLPSDHGTLRSSHLSSVRCLNSSLGGMIDVCSSARSVVARPPSKKFSRVMIGSRAMSMVMMDQEVTGGQGLARETESGVWLAALRMAKRFMAMARGDEQPRPWVLGSFNQSALAAASDREVARLVRGADRVTPEDVRWSMLAREGAGLRRPC